MDGSDHIRQLALIDPHPLDPPQSTCKTVSRSIQAFFAQLTAEDPYALQ